MTHGSLFSGIGGFDLAAQNVGITNVFQVEKDSFCLKVLNKNFPDTNKHDDVKDFRGEMYSGKIDIVSGGFPCQDISIAGVTNGRAGLSGSRSGLFYEMIRIIDEIKPRYVIWENSSYIHKYLNDVIKSFKGINYVCWQKKITARSLGYPHKRERMYGVAIATADGFGFDKIKNFDKIFREVQKQEIFRCKEINKAKFNRAFGDLLQNKATADICRANDGIPSKLDGDRIKALGNAIVPQIAEMIFKCILLTENKVNYETR